MTSEGFSLPEKAFIEHNIFACGKLYVNIKLSELGKLIGLDSRRTEKVVAKMITESRLNAFIDQNEELLEYVNEDNEIKSWDKSIEAICDDVSDNIFLIFPLIY